MKSTPMKRLLAVALGAVLLAVPTYIGYLSQTDKRLIWWFGISSAILVQLGLKLFGYAFRSDETLVRKLARVPEIGTLMKQAQSQEERVKILANERASLEEIVRTESQRLALADRIDSLETDASRILGELRALDKVASELGQSSGQSAVSDEIRRLRERIEARERGDVVVNFGGQTYRIDQSIVMAIPIIGDMLLGYCFLVERMFRRLKAPHDDRAGREK